MADDAVRKAVDPMTDGSGGWASPALTAGMTFADVGSYGLRQFGGWVREEFLPQLVGRQASRVFREMSDNNPTVGAVLFAISQSIRKVEWRVQPASDAPEAAAEAEFADGLRSDMSHTWEDFISEALSMLTYGFAPHEIVYKRRNGPKREGSDQPGSEHDDGRIGWRRLPIRGQDTVIKWFFDPNGQVQGLTQQPWVGSMIDIPIEKLLLFRPSAHKNNPEGRSVLRSAYVPWYFLKRMQELEAILFERFGGLPTLYVPNALLEAARAGDANASAALNAYKQIITNVRLDEQMGVILPSDPFMGPNGPTSTRMYEFALTSPQSGRASVDPNVSIERYKLDIMTSVMADFLQLGHGARGTQSLALSKVDMFFQAIEGWVTSIASVLNRYGLPRVWRLNNLDPALKPEYVPDLTQRIDLDALGNFILHCAQAGMQMFPDEDLESWIRDAAGMPDLLDDQDQTAARTAAQTDDLPADPELVRKWLLGTAARRVKKSRVARAA